MNSKIDRLSIAFENLGAAIKYYLKDIEYQNNLGKISRKDYFKIVNNLIELNNIIFRLKSSLTFNDLRLDKIRVINLTIKDLYEEGDYNALFDEICVTNSNLCRIEKDNDRKQLGKFRQIFNGLSNFYQFRLSKAVKNDSGDIDFRGKTDNVKFILENYLNIKYNFKKIKYETIQLNDIPEYQIIERCMQVLNLNKIDDNTKNIYKNIIIYVTEYAKAKVIIENLEKLKELCDTKEYLNIKEKADSMILKYKKIYDEYKNKFNIEIQKLGIDSDIMEFKYLFEDPKDNKEVKVKKQIK